MHNYTIFEPRCEADNYGFSVWLASYLGLDAVPVSRRRLQHGWYWFPYSAGKHFTNFFYSMDNGILVQNDEYARGLCDDLRLAFATGLPFQTYYNYSGVKGKHDGARKGVLFVPSRSYYSADYGSAILESVKRFAEHVSEFSILLSFDDRDMAATLSAYSRSIEIGAGIGEINSFSRIAKTFESYETVVTTSMGSHVFYADLCGAKVFIPYIEPYELKGTDLVHVIAGRMGDLYKSEFYSEKYLRERFPFLFSPHRASGSGLLQFDQKMSQAHPRAVAHLLGWVT